MLWPVFSFIWGGHYVVTLIPPRSCHRLRRRWCHSCSAKDIKADRDHSTSSVMVLFTSTAVQKPLQLSPPHLFSSASILWSTPAARPGTRQHLKPLRTKNVIFLSLDKTAHLVSFSPTLLFPSCRLLSATTTSSFRPSSSTVQHFPWWSITAIHHLTPPSFLLAKTTSRLLLYLRRYRNEI